MLERLTYRTWSGRNKSYGRVAELEATPANTAPGDVAYAPLARVEQNVPQPLQLHVSTRIQTASQNALVPFLGGPFHVCPDAGETADWSQIAENQGHLLIEMAANGDRVRFVCDIVPGRYQLPACTYASVEAKIYNQTTSDGSLGEGTKVSVGAALCAGITANPSEWTMTGFATAPAGSGLTMFTSPVAKYFDVGSENEAAELRVSYFNGRPEAVHAVVRDYANQVFLPPWPRLDYFNYPAGSASLLNDAAVDVQVCQRLYLEP